MNNKKQTDIDTKIDDSAAPLNFIESIIEKDLKNGRNDGRIHTRFPPEPNGYLHIGHAKAICLSFGLAQNYNGVCNLRFDDTNPVKEDVEYVDSIMDDIKWLGFKWNEEPRYASDNFDQLYELAVKLIKADKAYVCELSPDKISEYRGKPTQPGIDSPCRDRDIQESLDLFEQMKAGEFKDGTISLRAKIDMSSPNMHMRDPILYRVKHAHHHRTGDKWCIYPMYDFAHGQSDYIEGITHSLCTLEFAVHRPLYDWLLDQLFEGEYRPYQTEFARLNLSYTIMSKRKLLQLVEEKIVNGWDDPRLPTITGLRRRGFTPESIKSFADKIGVAKRENIIDVALLEQCLREDLNKKAERRMAVLNPLKVVITNYPDDQDEELEAINNPENESAGKRKIPFSKHLYIEKEDFMEDAPRKFFRLAPGREVRLRYAYFVKCNEVIKDEKTGEIIELHCTYDPESRGGKSPDGRKVKGTLHWVSLPHAVETEVRLYDRLFVNEDPNVTEGDKDFTSNLNPNSLKIITAYTEPSLQTASVDEKFQFERLGYFNVDKDSTSQKPVFNRSVPLRDTWSKISKKK